MYMNALLSSNNGKCRLLSPIQKQTAGSCVHFFYFTTGLKYKTIFSLLVLYKIFISKVQLITN